MATVCVQQVCVISYLLGFELTPLGQVTKPSSFLEAGAVVWYEEEFGAPSYHSRVLCDWDCGGRGHQEAALALTASPLPPHPSGLVSLRTTENLRHRGPHGAMDLLGC
jgi:hypothetical protein